MTESPFGDCDLGGLWEGDEEDDSPSDTTVKRVEDKLGVRLPSSFIWLAQQHNGGYLRRNTIKNPLVPGELLQVSNILSIGLTETRSIGGKFATSTIFKEWGYPRNVGILFAETPSAGHDFFFLDYRHCGPDGEPSVVHIDQERDYCITPIAKNFEEFIRSLARDPNEVDEITDTDKTPNHPQEHGIPSPHKRTSYALPENRVLISDLNNYTKHWTLVARISSMTPINHFVSKGRNGKVFSVVLADESDATVKGVFFDRAAEIFSESIKLQGLYEVSGGQVRVNIYPTDNQEYSIVFNEHSNFTELSPTDYPLLFNRFTPIKQALKEENSLHDIIGVVVEVHPTETGISHKTNSSFSRRKIVIGDDSGVKTEVVVWGYMCRELECGNEDVIVLRSVKTKEFNGIRHLQIQRNTLFSINPDIPAAGHLREWFARGDRVLEYIPTHDHSPKLMLLESIDGRVPYVEVYGSFMECLGGRALVYPSCPNPECRNKRLTEVLDTFVCDKCHRTIENPELKFCFRCKICDFTGSVFATVIGRDLLGETLLGLKPVEAEKANPRENPRIKEREFREYKIGLRIREDLYKGVLRTTTFVTSISRIDYAKASRLLFDEIKKYSP